MQVTIHVCLIMIDNKSQFMNIHCDLNKANKYMICVW